MSVELNVKNYMQLCATLLLLTDPQTNVSAKEVLYYEIPHTKLTSGLSHYNVDFVRCAQFCFDEFCASASYNEQTEECIIYNDGYGAEFNNDVNWFSVKSTGKR